MIKNIDLRAIVLATLAVIGIDFVRDIVLFNVFTDNVATASEEQVRAAAAALMTNFRYLSATLVLGTASTVLGGFLVARIARSIPYFNALGYGVVCIVLGMVLTTVEAPTWFEVVGIGSTVPASLLGAYFGKPLPK
jgi:hypothetical protein